MKALLTSAATRVRALLLLAAALLVLGTCPAWALPIGDVSPGELNGMQELYAIDGNAFSGFDAAYTYNNSGSIATGSYTRVGYYFQLGNAGNSSPWVWVSFDSAITSSTVSNLNDPHQLGVPRADAYSTTVPMAFWDNGNVILHNLHVEAGNGAPVTTFAGDGHNGTLEFWNSNYGQGAGHWDWRENGGGMGGGHGSMKIFEFPGATTGIANTLFGVTRGGGSGIGNQNGNTPGVGDTSWTFATGLGGYSTHNLQIWVGTPITITDTLTWHNSDTGNWGATDWQSLPNPTLVAGPNIDTVKGIVGGGIVTVDANRTAHSLEQNGGQVIIGPGNTLTLAHGIASAPGTSLVMSPGSSLAVTGGGTINSLSVSGTATLNAGAGTVTVANTTMASSLVKAGAGTVNLQNVTAAPGSAFNVSAGTLAAQAPQFISNAGLVLSGGTFQVAGASTTLSGLAETIFNTSTGDAQGNIEGYRTRALSLGADDAKGLLTSALHYQDDAAVSARAAALGAVGFDNGDFAMLWVTTFTPTENGAWGFRTQNGGVDDNMSFWIDTDGNGTFEIGNRFYNRGCCGDTGDTFTASLTSGTPYKLGIVMNDTGGGGYLRNVQFKAPSGAWTALDPSLGGQGTLWTTVANGPISMGSTNVLVTAGTTGSRISTTTDSTASFGTLTFGAASDLTVSVSNPAALVNFAKIVTNGSASLGLSGNVTIPGYDDQGIPGTFRMYGTKTLTLAAAASADVNAKATNFQVDTGATFRVAGVGLLGGDPVVSLNGGTFTIAPPASLPTYPNAYMAETDVKVLANSTINGAAAGAVELGNLEFSAPSVLATAGSTSGFAFIDTTFKTAGTSGFNTGVRTFTGAINGGGFAPTIVKQGASDLILTEGSVGLAGAQFQVQAGRLVVDGPANVTGATLNIAGGNLVLASPTGGNQTYPNAITSTASGILTAGTGGVGVASGNISVSSLTPGLGTTIELRAEAPQSLLLPNGATAPGNLNVTQGSVRVTNPLNVSTLSINGGTTTLTANATLANSLVGSGGTLATQGNITITPTQALAFGGTLRVESNNLTINVPASGGNPIGTAAYYSFDNISGGQIVNEGSLGTTKNATLNDGATIPVGTGHNGTNGVYISGWNGGDVRVLQGADNKGLDLSGGNWTASIWYKSLIGGGDWHTLFHAGSNDDYQTIINEGTRHINALWGGNQDSGYTLPSGDTGWHMFTTVGTPGASKFYIDGTYVAATTWSSTSDIFSIGAHQGNVHQFANNLDDFYFFQRALAPTEIQALYQIGLGVPLPPSLGDVRLAGGTSVTLSGVPAAGINVTSIGAAAAGPIVTGPMLLTNVGAPAASANPAGTTVAVDATINATNFNVTGPGTITLTKPLTVTGNLSVAADAKLSTQNTLAITANAGTAWVNVKGGLDVAGAPGTTLTFAVPAVSAATMPGLGTSLQAWYDASKLNLANGAAVTTWNDVSGNGHTATLTAGTMTFATNQLNGQPVVQFADNTYANTIGNMYSKEQYVVVSLDAGDWGAFLGSNVRSGYMLNQNGNFWDQNYPVAVSKNGASVGGAPYSLGDDQPYMLLKITGNDFDTSLRTYSLGRSEGWNRLVMNLAEILAFNVPLNATDENNVAGYLAKKYGISTSYTGSVGVPSLGNLTMAPGTNLTLTGGAAAAFDSIRTGAGATITGNVINNGPVAPGSSPGTLNIVGNYTQGAGSSYEWETVGNGAGQSDLIAVTGNLDASANWTLSINPLAAVTSGMYNLFTYGGGLTGGPAWPNVTLTKTGAYADLVNLAGSSIDSTSTPGAVKLNLAMNAASNWTSGGDINWNVATNWNSGAGPVPTASIAAIVNTNVATATVTQAMGTQAASSLVVDNGRVLVNANASLTIANNANVTSAGQLTVNGSLKVGDILGRPELLNGIVGLYRFDDSANLGKDTSGLGYNAANSGATYSAAGHSGGAASFPGSNEYLQLPSNTTLDNVQEGNYTIAAWVRAATVPPGTGDQNNAHYGAIEKAGFHTGLRYTNTQRFAMDNWLTGNVGNGAETTDTYAAGGWHQVVAVVARSLGTMSMYVDGVYEGGSTFTAGTLPIEYNNTPWRIGIANPGAGNYRWAMDGLIDDAAIWSRALDAADIQALYTYGPQLTRVGGTLTTAGTTTFGPSATLDIPEIKVTGGTTTAQGTTLLSGTTLRLAGGTLAGSFNATNPSTTASTYAYEVETGTSNASLGGTLASLRKSTAGAAILNGPVNLNRMDVAEGGLTMKNGNVNALTIAAGSSMTLTDSINIATEFKGSGVLNVPVNNVALINAPAATVNFSGNLNVLNGNPGNPNNNLTINVPAGGSTIAGLTTGLIGYWPFDSVAAGVTPDASGAGHPGTVTNATLIAGQAGNALTFDGASAFVGTGVSLLNNLPQFTMSGWVKPNANGGRIGLYGQNDAIEAGLDNQLAIWAAGSGYITGGNPITIPAADWHQVAYVGDGTGLRIYVDGAQVSAGGGGTGNYGASGFPFNIGGGGIWDGGGNWFNGGIDDVAVWNQALSPTQIAAVYQAGLSGGRPSLGALRLDPGTKVTLGGAGAATFTSIATVGGPTVTGPLLLSGGGGGGGVAAANTGVLGLTTVQATNFNVTGPGTVSLYGDLTVASGGSLAVPSNATLSSEANLTLNASAATVTYSGGLNIASGTTLTLSGPPTANTSNTLVEKFFNGAPAIDTNTAVTALINSPTATVSKFLTRSIDFGSDAAFNTEAGVALQDNFSVVWAGTLKTPSGSGGTWSFGYTGRDDQSSLWLDTNQNGTFEQSERVAYNSTPASVALAGGASYKFALTLLDGGGGSALTGAYFNNPAGGGNVIIDPSSPAQSGMWSYGYGRFGNLTMADNSHLVVSGANPAAFSSVVAGWGATVSGNIAVDSLLRVSGPFEINSSLELSDGLIYEWGLRLNLPLDVVHIAGNLIIDKSFTLDILGLGGSALPGDVFPLFVYQGNLYVNGLPWNSSTNPLQYLIDISNLADPFNQYQWDLTDARIGVQVGEGGGMIYLTGLEALAVPEPATLSLLALGGLALLRRRRRAAS